jgi:hypothetical protein
LIVGINKTKESKDSYVRIYYSLRKKARSTVFLKINPSNKIKQKPNYRKKVCGEKENEKEKNEK